MYLTAKLKGVEKKRDKERALGYTMHPLYLFIWMILLRDLIERNVYPAVFNGSIH